MIFLSILLGVVGIILTIYIFPDFLLKSIERNYPEVIFRIKTTKKMVALTIDDGIKKDSTEKILDVLQKHKVKVTFFLIGNSILQNDPDRKILNRMKYDGHELGNHTMNNTASIRLPIKELIRQLEETDKILETKTKYFRPGHGYLNQEMLDVIKGKYKLVLGSNYPHDPAIRIPWLNKLYVLWRLRSNPSRNIIILHDFHHSIETLDDLIPKIKNMGFEFGTLSDLSDNL